MTFNACQKRFQDDAFAPCDTKVKIQYSDPQTASYVDMKVGSPDSTNSYSLSSATCLKIALKISLVEHELKI